MYCYSTTFFLQKTLIWAAPQKILQIIAVSFQNTLYKHAMFVEIA